MSEHVDDLWSADVVLSSGDTASIRAMTPDDAPRLQAFHARQSRESIYRRFFSPKPTMSDAMSQRFARIEPDKRAALAVESGDELIGWASYERWAGRDDAEVAFMVDDRHHGKGIATLLLEHLAAIARSHGIRRFSAETLADNRSMLAVFSKAGWPVQRRFDSGVFDIDFDLTDDAQYVESVEQREQRSDSRAMARLLLPRSIAVIGASDKPGSVGATLWEHLRSSFDGPLYAVNPNRDRLGDVEAHPTIGAIHDDISLAIIAVPVESLVDTIHECTAKRVRGAVVITAVDGTDIDVAALVSHARRYGMRLVGPASMGIASPLTGLQAALVNVTAPAGGVAVSMQSGSLGGSLLRLATDMSMGLAWFVSLGDKSDVSANDLLQFWEDDDSTSVIALYTETFGNPSKFMRIARRVATRRPIVAVRTGAAAVTDATGAIYQHAGVIEVPTVRALLETTRVLSTQPVPSGPRVAVLTNARSPGILTGAAIQASGMQPVSPPRPLSWRATADDYGVAVEAALEHDDIDAVIVIYAPAVPSSIAEPAAQIDEASRNGTKPVLAVMLGGRDGPIRDGSPVPSFTFPEPAVAVLARMWAYGQWCRLQAETPSSTADALDTEQISELVGAVLQSDRTELRFDEIRDVLMRYGLNVGRASAADGPDDAVAAAHEIGYPVAVKARRRHVGRSVRAGVALDLETADDVVHAVAAMQETLGEDAASVTVQSMVPPGVDVRIRARAGDRVGPIISVGLGGVQAEVIDTGASRLAPVSTAAAGQLVRTSRAGAALAEADLDTAALIDAVVRVSQLAFQHPELVELELNPVIVSSGACWVTDANARVGVVPPPDPLRRLT